MWWNSLSKKELDNMGHRHKRLKKKELIRLVVLLEHECEAYASAIKLAKTYVDDRFPKPIQEPDIKEAFKILQIAYENGAWK